MKKTSLLGKRLGNYHLIELLGSGGFADVYRGIHIHLGTVAAVKVLLRPLASSGIEKFRKEAQILAALNHPHIVPILEFGIENDYPFLVMSYATNGTLRQPPEVRLPVAEILPYIGQVASALQYIHDNQFMHLDIKPENLLLGPHREILLSDFGVARRIGPISEKTSERVMGTIAYMAPEQLRGQPEPASDQYALGVVIYEWLCGVCPFVGPSEMNIAAQHLQVAPSALGKYVAGIPTAVEQAILRALAKEPAQRFSGVQAFITAVSEGYQASQATSSAPQEDCGMSSGPVIPSLTVPIAGRHSVLQTAKVLSTYIGHKDEINSVSWSPDGITIASASEDRTVHLWHVQDGRRISIYTKHACQVWMALWSPDGKRIASAGVDQIAHVWNPETGHRQCDYKGHSEASGIGFTYAMSWSPDGKSIVTGSNDQTLQVWSAASGKKIFTSVGHTNWILSIAWSPDGQAFVSGSDDKTARIWNATQGNLLLTYQGHISSVRAVAWSPDGSSIASASRDGQVHIWQAKTGQTQHIYTGHRREVRGLAWSPDGMLIVSCGDDKTLQVWEAHTERCVYRNSYSGSRVNTVAWSPDGTLLAYVKGDQVIEVLQIKA